MSWIEAAGAPHRNEGHIPVVRPLTRRFPVPRTAGPGLPLNRNARHLGRSGTSRVTRVLPNMMSDDQDHSLDLTQWTEVEAAPDGGILAGVVGEDRVFVWRSGNRLKAYSADCPHLGAPLNKGIVIRRDHPLPVASCVLRPCDRRSDGGSRFRPSARVCGYPRCRRFCVKPGHEKAPRRIGRREDSLGTMAIIGGGAAGFAAADAIRKLGWQGGLTIFSEEAEQPYDRTLLTKDYLEGAFGDDRLPIARHSLATLASTSKVARASNESSPEANASFGKWGRATL